MSYVAILDTQLDPDAPLTSQLMYQTRDNPLAIAAGLSNSPYDMGRWHPYNGVNVGDGATGEIYNFATDGVVSSVESPSFVDGYEYRFIYENLSPSFAQTFSIQFFRNTDAAYATARVISLSIPANNYVNGFVSIERPMINSRVHFFSNYSLVNASNTTVGDVAAVVSAIQHTTSQKISKAKLYFNGVNIDNGTIVMQKRLVY